MKRLFLLFLLLCAWGLCAVGLHAQSHSVTANWTASPDAPSNPSLSYNVYRATGACSSSPTFSKINSTAAGVLSFTDTAVSVGQTLCYEITAVLNGLESAPSASAQAVILPSSPSGLSVTAK